MPIKGIIIMPVTDKQVTPKSADALRFTPFSASGINIGIMIC
jgi:hypothetical protein